MITDLYKEGGIKEMKKWAYEIHSSFLLPGAVSITFILSSTLSAIPDLRHNI